MCKTIKQKVTFRAEPADVYGLLVSPEDEVGRRFRMGEGSGVVVDLAPAKRVVRAWREGDYPEGVFSMAAFTLRQTTTGTELTLTHRGVPKDLIPRTEERWRRDYWDAFKKTLAASRRDGR
jgi:uncharacterized protein YndB with AHSA1/START domain